MRLSLWKKAAVLGLAFTMTMSLTACGGIKGNKADARSTELSVDAKELVFKGEDIDASDVKGEVGLNSFVRLDDKIYFFTIENLDEGASDSDDSGRTFIRTHKIYSMNADGTGLTQICEPEIGDYGVMQTLMFDKDKNMIIFSSYFDHKAEKNRCYISRIDENGKVKDSKDFADIINSDTLIFDMCEDDKGNYIAVSSDKVFVLDSNFNMISDFKCDKDKYLYNCAKTADGKIFCGLESDNDINCVCELDVENKKFGEPIEVGRDQYISNLVDGDEEYDLYYEDGKDIYGFSVKDKTSKMLVDYTSSGVTELRSFIMADSQNMIGGEIDISGTKLTCYKKVDPSQVKDKTVITFGSLKEVDSNIVNAASKFNSESDKYKIEFKDYSSEEDPQTKMNADILAGNVPDIIEMSDIPVNQYASKGLLEDLTSYFENDDVVKKDDIIPAVEKAMEIDGKLYYTSTEFLVGCLCAKKESVGNRTGWTANEFEEFLEEQDDDVSPFYSESKADELNLMMEACVEDYIDWSKGECSFDSDSFKTILEIAGRGTDKKKKTEPEISEILEDLKSGKILFMENVLRPCDIEIDSKMFGSEITALGYPCDGYSGSYFALFDKLGIYSKSEVKDGAWEFIRTLMTKDYQLSNEFSIGNPTNKDAFESFMKKVTATEAYTDEYGHNIAPYGDSVYMDDMEITAGPVTPENEKMYRELIDRTTKIQGNCDKVLEIISEEAVDYFNGHKSVDETAAIVQERVNKYVNEFR